MNIGLDLVRRLNALASETSMQRRQQLARQLRLDLVAGSTSIDHAIGFTDAQRDAVLEAVDASTLKVLGDETPMAVADCVHFAKRIRGRVAAALRSAEKNPGESPDLTTERTA